MKDFGQYWPNFSLLVAKKVSEIGVSWHSKENSWREWPQMWHADVSWPPPEIIWFWPLLAQFRPTGGKKTLWNWGFRAFLEEHMEGMAWNVVCWCILTTSEIIWFWPVFGCSMNFQNAWKGWPENGEHRHIFYSLHWALSSLSLVLGQGLCHHQCLAVILFTHLLFFMNIHELGHHWFRQCFCYFCLVTS